jgi:beta-glucanase (GH16 family)
VIDTPPWSASVGPAGALVTERRVDRSPLPSRRDVHRRGSSPPGRVAGPACAPHPQRPPLVRHSSDRPARGRGRRTVAVALAATTVVGVSLAAGVSQAAAPNLVDNPGFERGLTGWFAAAPFALTRVGSSHGGDWAAELRNGGGSTRTGALNDLENTVATTQAGHVYRARAYVRARSGRRVAVRLMEFTGSTLRGENATTLSLSDTGWHRVQVRYTAVSTGASLDLNVVAAAMPAGATITVDDVKLVDEGLAGPPVTSPAPTVTASAGPSAPSTVSPSSAPTATGTTSSSPSSPPTNPTSSPSSSPAPPAEPAPTAAPPVPAPAGWTLAWSDEFDGPVDAARWTVDHLSTYGDGNNELACLMNRPENVFTSAGVLTIRARREASPVACGSADSRFPNGRAYSSAMMRTKASWTYGRFEMRAKLPTAAETSKGLWPAFWMRPTAGGSGELDILEAIGSGAGGNTAKRIHQTIWYDYSGTYPKETYTAATAFDPSGGFHTYAVEWDPGQIRWSIDGVTTWTRTTSSTSWLEPAFSKPFFIRLNMAVGGSWPGSPDADTAFPADYQVDYVRVYER